jgi:hypothetical protein
VADLSKLTAIKAAGALGGRCAACMPTRGWLVEGNVILGAPRRLVGKRALLLRQQLGKRICYFHYFRDRITKDSCRLGKEVPSSLETKPLGTVNRIAQVVVWRALDVAGRRDGRRGPGTT